MKRNIFTVLLSLLAGFIGAYLFSKLDNGNTNGTQAVELVRQGEVAESLEIHRPVPYATTNVNGLPKGEGGDILSFSEASGVATQSVVYIKTYTQGAYSRRSTWLDLFFERSPSREGGIALGSGSGVIFSDDGYIVTNNHVIANSDKIEVVHNKRTYKAKLIGTDTSTDLALLKIEAENLPSIRVASSRELQVGDWVLAVGNPFNLATTVTAGIVSAKGRKINILKDVFPIESFIQTDAAINPGNSGGALVNVDGDLVGINTAILSRTGSYAGYGFAVPSDIVAKVVNDLKKYGEVQKAFIGAEVVEVDEQISNKLNLDNVDGIVVSRVDVGGAAEKGGVEVGDVIVEIDNFEINTEADFAEQLSFYVPGDEIRLKYIRNGKLMNTYLVLTNLDGTTGISKREVYNAESIGATFESVPKFEKTKLGLESGIRVMSLKRGGLLDRMDLRKGMLILAINRYPVNSAEDFTEILERIRGRVILEVMTERGDKKYYSYYF
ncbi:trypsin-like peptidase domain-containing protein [Limibacter armeniacum]|uniref:trypsin-like peptidase domain-containing protein n=1 Tax=Limibacter armeniacum TaxID=466084 RepID=UPI002FE69241